MNSATTNAGYARNARVFDPAAWLAAFEQIGGAYALDAYALDAAGKLWLLTDRCTGLHLLALMPLLTDYWNCVEAVRVAVVVRRGFDLPRGSS